MRFLPIIVLCSVAGGIAPVLADPGIAPAAGTDPNELITTQDAILCLDPANLHVANERAMARTSIVLRAMGCVRIESGIRTRLLEEPEFGGSWRVRLYPKGISSGVVLWGLPTAFAAPDGSKPVAAKRAAS